MWYYPAICSRDAGLVQIEFAVFPALADEACAWDWYEPLHEISCRLALSIDYHSGACFTSQPSTEYHFVFLLFTYLLLFFFSQGEGH